MFGLLTKLSLYLFYFFIYKCELLWIEGIVNLWGIYSRHLIFISFHIKGKIKDIFCSFVVNIAIINVRLQSHIEFVFPLKVKLPWWWSIEYNLRASGIFLLIVFYNQCLFLVFNQNLDLNIVSKN